MPSGREGQPLFEGPGVLTGGRHVTCCAAMLAADGMAANVPLPPLPLIAQCSQPATRKRRMTQVGDFGRLIECEKRCVFHGVLR